MRFEEAARHVLKDDKGRVVHQVGDAALEVLGGRCLLDRLQEEPRDVRE